MKGYPERYQVVQFEIVYSGSFPDTLICNSEMWVCAQYKQSGGLSPVMDLHQSG